MGKDDVIIKFNVSLQKLQTALENLDFAATQKFLVSFVINRNLN